MSVAALEARARGTHNVLSPVLDLARDPRWGRTEETYGEDPYLVSRLGVAAIRGYQGTSRTLAKDKVLATAKHFAGHGPHEGGINTAPTAFAERVLRDEYLFPFEAAIARDAGDGGDAVLQRDGRRPLPQEPLAARPRAPAGMGLRRHGRLRLLRDRPDGVPPRRGRRPGRRGAPGPRGGRGRRAARHRGLPDAGGPREGRDASPRPSSIARSRASSRAKFLAGLFEDPYVDPDRAEQVSNTPEHQALALEAARRAHRLAEERGRPAAPGSREAQDDRGHRAQRQGRPPRRLLQRCPAAAWTSSTASRRRRAPACASSTRRARASPSCPRTGTGTRSSSAIPCKNRQRIAEAVDRGAPGGRGRGRDRHQRVHLARGLGGQPPRRRRGSSSSRPSRTSSSTPCARHGQAGGRGPHQRAAPGPEPRRGDGARRSSRGSTSARKAAPPLAEVLFGDVNPGREAADLLPARDAARSPCTTTASRRRSGRTWTSRASPCSHSATASATRPSRSTT